ncbi:hypothetical protein F4819DRAFT_488770 [Hypoxylon fuscum]|nr:hypothetical protein F4819DRAFT_488770 [Hypoxylon fuscum]
MNMSKMVGLQDIEIMIGVGNVRGLVYVLQKRPQIRLHVKIPTYAIYVESPSNFLLQLEGCQNLYSLDIDHYFTNFQQGSHIVGSLGETLHSCFNLRNLRLNIRYLNVFNGPLQYPGLGFVEGERPAALESLEVIAFPFGTDGYLQIGREQDYWINNFDWSRLKRLCTFDSSLLCEHMHSLSSLKEVELIGTADPALGREFFDRATPRLETIAVPRYSAIGMDGILKHGKWLRSLCIHKTEGCQEKWTSPGLNADRLECIRQGCPHIEELSVDIGECYETLDSIARFPKLRSLTLCFPLLSEDNEIYYPSRQPIVEGQWTDTIEEPSSPPLTFRYASELFRYLRQISFIQPSPLKRLRVKSGVTSFLDPNRDNRLGLPRYIENNVVDFLCEITERDDEVARHVHTVTCMNVCKKENKIMRQALEVGIDPLDLVDKEKDGFKKVSRDFKYAWYGSMPYAQWRLYHLDEYGLAHGKFLKHRGEDWVIENWEDYRSLMVTKGIWNSISQWPA